MITNQKTFKTFPVQRGAIKVALEYYIKWKSDAWLPTLSGFIWFVADVIDYLLNGFIVCTPRAFYMLKLTEIDGEPGWFCRMAVGDLRELLLLAPGIPPKIAFCRRNDGRLRIYDFRRLMQKGTRVK